MKNILILFILLTVTSCLGTKKTTERNSEIVKTELLQTKKDSISDTKTQVSEAINDKLVIDVGNSGSVECDEKIDEILKKLNTSKSSGGNSYNSRYDAETRQILVDFIIAQTENKETTLDINSEIQSEKSIEEKTSENISKVVKVVPWWLWVILIFWFAPAILEKLQMIINPLSILTKNFKK